MSETSFASLIGHSEGCDGFLGCGFKEIPMPETSSNDSVTHAPESGEPTETGRPVDRSNPDAAVTSEKSPPGQPKQGEDFDSGRADAKA